MADDDHQNGQEPSFEAPRPSIADSLSSLSRPSITEMSPLRPSKAPTRVTMTGRVSQTSPPPAEPPAGEAMAAGGAEEDAFDTTLADLLAAIRKHVWAAAAIALLVTFGAAAYGLSQTKIYSASATLQIDPKPPTPLGRGVESVVEMGSGSYWASIEYYNTQHKLIASKPVAIAVAEELGLHHDAAFMANSVQAPAETPGEPPTAKQAAGVLMSRLTVTPTKESRLVDVSYEDADKERAVRVLDAVLRAYVSHNANKALSTTSNAVEWLGEQLEELKKELSASELALHEYKLQKQIASIGLDSQATLLAKEMGQLNEERTGVLARIQEASARLSQLKKISPDDPETIPQTGLLATVGLSTLRADYVGAVRDKNALVSAGKGSRHPQVQAAEARIAATRSSLAIEVRNIQNGAQRDLAALQQQAGGLKVLLADAEKEALELNLMDIEYSRLERTKENNEKLYSLVLERSKEAGLTQMLRVNNIQILAAPTPSGGPIKPRLSLIVMAGGLAGLALGLAFAFMRERLDRSVKTPADLEERLGLTPLGTVPNLDKQAGLSLPNGKSRRRRRGGVESPERLVATDPSSSFAEALRAVRTNLLFMSPDQPFHRLLVTSAGPSEGKTTVASSLAIAMAQAGHKVLLIDCDMRKPRQHTIFEETAGPRSTVSQSLIEPQSFRATTLHTRIENLSVLPAGPTPPNPSELLHSEAFGQFLDRLDADYDLLLLDSPPLVVTDAAIMSARVDGVVLVVRAFQTHRAAVARAVRSLRDVGAHVVGGVLNAMQYSKGGYGYGYGYGGYGRYGQNEGDGASDDAQA